jgi:hypothetical protein
MSNIRWSTNTERGSGSDLVVLHWLSSLDQSCNLLVLKEWTRSTAPRSVFVFPRTCSEFQAGPRSGTDDAEVPDVHNPESASF